MGKPGLGVNKDVAVSVGVGGIGTNVSVAVVVIVGVRDGSIVGGTSRVGVVVGILNNVGVA
jgi:hypothetical protein